MLYVLWDNILVLFSHLYVLASFPVFPMVSRRSSMCFSAEGPHHSSQNIGFQSRWSGPGLWRSGRPDEYLVPAGKKHTQIHTVFFKCTHTQHTVCINELFHTLLLCVAGWLSAADCRSWFRGHPEHSLDPRCGCGCLFQQVKGEQT